MRLIINIILIGGLSYFSGSLGWFEWDFAIIAFIIAFVVNANGWSSFLSGLLSISILWFSIATMMNHANEGILTESISSILGLSSGNILLITGLVGGLVGGFSALTGSLARLVINPPLKDLRRKKTWRKW